MDDLAQHVKVVSNPNRLAVLEAKRGRALNMTAMVKKRQLGHSMVSKQ